MTRRIDNILHRAAIGLALVLLSTIVLHAAPDDEEASPDAKINAPFVQRMAGFNLEGNVFIGSGNAQRARGRCNAQLKMRIAELDRVSMLSAQQKAKLQLAGHGDFELFFDRFEEVRAEVEPVMKNNPQAWQNIWPKIGPLQQKFQSGLLGERSFFGKVVRKTLTSEQWKKYERVQLERRRFHYLASIEATLTTLENTVAMSPGQHEAVAKILAASPPPLRSGQYDVYVVISRLRRLPKDKVNHLFEDRQQALLRQYGDSDGINRLLVQHGYLSQEEVGGDATATAESVDGEFGWDFEP